MQHTLLPPQNRRSNAMLPPCSLMLIRSVTFVWVSQMAFLPPSSPTLYPSPYPIDDRGRYHYTFHPRLLAYGPKLPWQKRGGVSNYRGTGRGLVCYGGAGGGFCRPWPLTGSCLQPSRSFHHRQPHDHLTVAKVAWQGACPRAPAQHPQMTTSIRMWPFLALRHSTVTDPWYPRMTRTATWPCCYWQLWPSGSDFSEGIASDC